MDTWSCPVGWPSQGLKAVASGGGGAGGVVGGGGASHVGGSHSTGGVVAVCRSNAGDVMAVSRSLGWKGGVTDGVFPFTGVCPFLEAV